MPGEGCARPPHLCLPESATAVRHVNSLFAHTGPQMCRAGGRAGSTFAPKAAFTGCRRAPVPNPTWLAVGGTVLAPALRVAARWRPASLPKAVPKREGRLLNVTVALLYVCRVAQVVREESSAGSPGRDYSADWSVLS